MHQIHSKPDSQYSSPRSLTLPGEGTTLPKPHPPDTIGASSLGFSTKEVKKVGSSQNCTLVGLYMCVIRMLIPMFKRQLNKASVKSSKLVTPDITTPLVCHMAYVLYSNLVQAGTEQNALRFCTSSCEHHQLCIRDMTASRIYADKSSTLKVLLR